MVFHGYGGSRILDGLDVGLKTGPWFSQDSDEAGYSGCWILKKEVDRPVLDFQDWIFKNVSSVLDCGLGFQDRTGWVFRNLDCFGLTQDFGFGQSTSDTKVFLQGKGNNGICARF